MDERRKRSWPFWVAVGVLPILGGCGESIDLSPPLDNAKVIAIAHKALIDNGSSVEQSTFDVEHDEKGWTVFETRYPRYPGGHSTIKIDANGKVTGIMGGH